MIASKASFKLKAQVRSLYRRLQQPILCSDCFKDSGLAHEARKIGKFTNAKCRNCGSRTGAKLNMEALEDLMQTYFVYGSFVRSEFGGASMLRLGEDDIDLPTWLESDARILRDKTGIGLRYNVPRTYLLGEVEPLEALMAQETEEAAAEDVTRRFPRLTFGESKLFFRLRKGVELGKENEARQYDAPPDDIKPDGRLNFPGFPVLYGSQDLDVCVHECRVTKADVCHLATLRTTGPLELLDLCGEVSGEDETPFESLYLAVQFIFSAEEHSYRAARAIAKAAKSRGLHGIAYPSYFSSLLPNVVPNLALFGYPIAEERVELRCVNRLQLDSARYGITLGPSI